MKLIYIHGGPGLNSEPEKNIFPSTNNFKFICWNEPIVSNTSKSSAYANWLQSVEDCINQEARDGKVIVMGHSFGAFALNEILPRISSQIHKVILVSPIFDLLTLDLNIMNLAIKLLEETGARDQALFFELKKNEMKSMTNSKRVEILAQALNIDGLLLHYWKKQDSAKSYHQYLEKRPVSFDSFMMVRKSIQEDRLRHSFSGAVSIFYGKYDPVSSLFQNQQLQDQLYPNAETFILDHSGHYPHLEESENLFSQINI